VTRSVKRPRSRKAVPIWTEELAGRFEHEHPGPFGPVRPEAVEHGQGEGGGLAGAGRGGGHEIASGEHDGDALRLDRSRLGIAQRLGTPHQAGVKSEFRERHPADPAQIPNRRRGRMPSPGLASVVARST